MDLINWEISAATNIAGQQVPAYPYAVFLMDTGDLDILINEPESPEAYAYFFSHCIASHFVDCNSRSGTTYLPIITMGFKNHIQKHRGSYLLDNSQDILVVPSALSFPNAPHLPVSFYQSHLSLLNTNRILGLTFIDFANAEILQEFDTPTYIDKVVYSTSITSSVNQRPKTVRILYLDTDNVWQTGPEATFTQADFSPRSLLLGVVCSAVKLVMVTAYPNQAGWAIDTFYCTTNVVQCIIESPIAVLVCPILAGQTYPSLPWSKTATPVLAYYQGEFECNRDTTDASRPIIVLTDHISLEAFV